MADVAISTYVRGASGDFVDLFAADVPVRRCAYLEGAIELRLHGKAVLDRELWDDVEYLWWGLVELVVRFRADGAAAVGFPDQPLRIRLERRERQWLRMTVEAAEGEVLRSGSATESELFEAVRVAAASVLPRFMAVNEYHPHTHQWEMERLERAFGAAGS